MQLWAPPPKLTVSEFADAERQLSPESSAEPGKYYTSRTPYAREIMDAFSDIRVKEVVFMSSAQVGKSTIGENVLHHFIVHDPAPILYVWPTLEMAEAASKDRIAPMIRDNPTLRARVVESGSRKGGNTLLHKNFLGGQLTIVGANSPSSLASRPIRIVLFEEPDRYDASAGTEGDPIRLALKRIATFWNSKVGYFSTPGIRGRSRTEEMYEDSDKRLYYIPCPHCSEMHVLRWENLHWTEGAPGMHKDGKAIRRATDAWFECPECHGRIDDVQRVNALQAGEWRATAPFHGRAGFWIWQAYSPWRTALQTANEWLSALGRPEQEKAVVNTVRGETWQESGESPDWEKLKGRADKTYNLGTMPKGALFLTCGIDVQKDRFECAVWGWGRGVERWLVDYRVIPCDTSRKESFDLLDAVIKNTWTHESGLDIGLSMTGIDAQYETTNVYGFARKWGAARVLPVHGKDYGQRLVWQSANVDYRPTDGKKSAKALRPYNLNVSMAKSELYRQLNSGEGVVSMVHIPHDIPDEILKQICAEQLETRYVKGYAKSEWVKIRDRNEALDTANIARGMAAHLGIDQFNERAWRAWESMFAATENEAAAVPEISSPGPQRAIAAPALQQPQAPRRRVIRNPNL